MVVDNKKLKSTFDDHSKTKKGKLSRSEAKKALEDLDDETEDFGDRWRKYSNNGFMDLSGFLKMLLPSSSPGGDAPLKSYSGHHSETHKSESKKKKDKKTYEEEDDVEIQKNPIAEHLEPHGQVEKPKKSKKDQKKAKKAAKKAAKKSKKDSSSSSSSSDSSDSSDSSSDSSDSDEKSKKSKKKSKKSKKPLPEPDSDEDSDSDGPETPPSPRKTKNSKNLAPELEKRRHRVKKTEEHEEKKDKEEHHESNDENFEFDTENRKNRDDPRGNDEILLEKSPEIGDSGSGTIGGHQHCCCEAHGEHEHSHEVTKTDKVVNKHHDCAKCQIKCPICN